MGALPPALRGAQRKQPVPGWPAGYPAAIVYKGEADATLTAKAPVAPPPDKATPFDKVAQGMDDLLLCTWFTTYKQNPSPDEAPELIPGAKDSCSKAQTSAGGTTTTPRPTTATTTHPRTAGGDDVDADPGVVVDGDETQEPMSWRGPTVRT